MFRARGSLTERVIHMITKAKDLRRSSFDKLRNGKGVVEMLNFFEEEQSGGVGRLFSVATLAPGVSIGEHKHEGNFEIYYIFQGSAQVTDNGVPGVLEPGDMMLCKDGDSHSIENKGTEDLVVLFLVLYTR